MGKTLVNWAIGMSLTAIIIILFYLGLKWYVREPAKEPYVTNDTSFKDSLVAIIAKQDTIIFQSHTREQKLKNELLQKDFALSMFDLDHYFDSLFAAHPEPVGTEGR